MANHFQSLLETPNLALNKLQPENNIFSWIVVFPILAPQQYSRKLSVIELQIDKCLRKLQNLTSNLNWKIIQRSHTSAFHNTWLIKLHFFLSQSCDKLWSDKWLNIRSVKVNVNITPQSTFRKWVFNNKWFYNLNHQRCIDPWCGPFWRPPTPHQPLSPQIYTPLKISKS